MASHRRDAMNTDIAMHSKCVSISALIALALAPARCVCASEDVAGLTGLARAEGKDYVNLRDALLEEHPGPWDVAVFARQSWETGLAAFILNARLAARDVFERWDKQEPRLYATGGWYDLSTYPNVGPLSARTAFLLEKMWKGIPDERHRGYAFATVKRGFACDAGVTALWKAIWEHSKDDQFRLVVIGRVCADPDPSVQPIILEVLHHYDNESAPYFKSRCLSGLWYRHTEETVDAILGAWDTIRNKRSWLGNALGALVANGSVRARRFVHEFILNVENDETLRGEALAKCCNQPQPDDVEIMRRFFAGPATVRVKTNALESIGCHCPLDEVRPVFREVLIQSNDPKMIASAALALDSAYILAKEVDEAARAEDITLLEGVRTREDLTNATRVHIGMYIERLRGNPNPRLPDRPGRDR